MSSSKRVVYREFGAEPEPVEESRALPPQQQKVRVQISRKGRNGKTVTVISGLMASPEDLKDLLKKLKNLCGAGGTIREDTIEVQGEHTDKLVPALIGLGYTQCKGVR